MIMRRTDLASTALDIACETREEAGLDLDGPINIFDLCESLSPRVRVQLVDFSMEACYIRDERPLIMVSALRPMGRRAFNCAHELGHHVHGHGSTIDQLQEEVSIFQQSNPKEFQANSFAGFLLMPKLGIRRAFTKRKWKILNSSPEQIFTVACEFGVGYATLVSHLAYSLREVSFDRARELLKVKLPKIRSQFVASGDIKRLWVVDENYDISTVDVESGTHVLLPTGSTVESKNLEFIARQPMGDLYLAGRPGLCRVTTENWAAIVRVSKYQYSGWSTNRHLELDDDEE